MTMMGIRVAAVAALALAFSIPVAAQPARVTIAVWSFGFAPNPLHLAAGRPVTLAFQNRSGSSHDFTRVTFFSSPPRWDPRLRRNEETGLAVESSPASNHVLGMAVDDDRHIAFALRRGARVAGGRHEMLGSGFGAAILRLQRTGVGDDLAGLHHSLRIDAQRHHLPAEQDLARLRVAGIGLRSRLEAPLEGDLGIFGFRAAAGRGGLGLARLVAGNVAGLRARGLQAGFDLAGLRLAVARNGDGDPLPPWRGRQQG